MMRGRWLDALYRIERATTPLFERAALASGKIYCRIQRKVLLMLNPQWYDEKHLGCDAAPALFFKNVLRPRRFLLRSLYGQVLPLPRSISAARAVEPFDEIAGISDLQKKLRAQGFIVLPRFFNSDVEMLEERYCRHRAGEFDGGVLSSIRVSILDDAFATITLNTKILALVGGAFRAQPFVQDMPVITVTDCSLHPRGDHNHELVTSWHYDDVNTIKALVYLTDVDLETPRLQVAVRSHRIPRATVEPSDSCYTDAYVRSNYRIADCIGPKGTVVIFDASILHRQVRVPGARRVLYASKYSPGNGLGLMRSAAKSFEFGKAKEIFAALPITAIQRQSIAHLLR